MSENRRGDFFDSHCTHEYTMKQILSVTIETTVLLWTYTVTGWYWSRG